MVLGIGTDIVEVQRIAKALTKQGFRDKVYTPGEITYCEAKRSHAAASYAARFAAKEALGKALGTGLTPAVLLEIQVVPTSKGQPKLILSGAMAVKAQEQGVLQIALSLSHTADLAIAYVVLEGKK